MSDTLGELGNSTVRSTFGTRHFRISTGPRPNSTGPRSRVSLKKFFKPITDRLWYPADRGPVQM